MINYAIYSNLEKDVINQILTSSFKVQVPLQKSLSLNKFLTDFKAGVTIIEFCIETDDSPATREESYKFKIFPWDGNKHTVNITILTAPGGDVINKSTDIVDSVTTE